ncbi:MAG: hypothetical protein H0W07_02375 [Chloroflexi bacterium]|nr:hypothetical protein [Chloroflexota bacterium]
MQLGRGGTASRSNTGAPRLETPRRRSVAVTLEGPVQEIDNGGEIDFPVDDETYNLLQTLVSKLEALDAYRTYLEDSEGDTASLYEELARSDYAQAERILALLRPKLAAG